MALRPVFAGRSYQLEIISPEIGHTEGRGNATFYILCVDGFGVTYGAVRSLRKFRRQMKRLLGVSKLAIKRSFVDCGDSPQPDHFVLWHKHVWDHLEKLEAAHPVNDRDLALELDAWSDWPGDPIPPRRCRIISYDRLRTCRVIFDGRSDIVEVPAARLFKISPRNGNFVDFHLEFATLPRQHWQDSSYGIRSVEEAA